MNPFRKRLPILLRQIATFVLVVIVFSTVGGSALAQNRVFTPDVNIDQTTLLNNGYTLRKVLESGEQFFSLPFTPEDAMGEGPNGPRAAQREVYYPHADITFLKLNGLGAQSCFECHHSIGNYREPGTQSQAMLRKPAASGGSAGVASNAYIDADFPDPLTDLIRNPPHFFGSGYTQQLATEMTQTLQGLKQTAHQIAEFYPGLEIPFGLSAKGVNFGTFKTECPAPNACDWHTGEGFVDDTSEVLGVASDLVVRPFQWKGIASSVRHFVRDALDFHFSMQAEEKFGSRDCDRDGFTDEVTKGNLSALTAFVAMTRPPQQVWPSDPKQRTRAQQGQQLFDSVNCAECHISSLKITEPTVLIANPGNQPQLGSCPGTPVYSTLVAPQTLTDKLFVLQQYEAANPGAQIESLFENIAPSAEGQEFLQQPSAVEEFLQQTPPVGEEFVQTLMATQRDSANTREVSYGTEQGYVINLTPSYGDDLPAYVYDRLPQNVDRSIDVPIYSDLKTHNMGKRLSDITAQGTDVAGISVPASQFLTRPLWGVGDTGPWLHDGRARSLKEAILMHANLSDPTDGSEAADAVRAFSNLNESQQDAIVEFLLTMQLPIQKNLEVSNAAPTR